MREPYLINTLDEAATWLTGHTGTTWTPKGILNTEILLNNPHAMGYTRAFSKVDQLNPEKLTEIKNPFVLYLSSFYKISCLRAAIKDTKFIYYRILSNRDSEGFVRTNQQVNWGGTFPLTLRNIGELLLHGEASVSAVYPDPRLAANIEVESDNEIGLVFIEPLNYNPATITRKAVLYLSGDYPRLTAKDIHVQTPLEPDVVKPVNVNMSMVRILGKDLISFSKAFAWREEQIKKYSMLKNGVVSAKSNSLLHQSEYLPKDCEIKGVPAWWNQEHDLLELAHTIAAKQKELGNKTSWNSIHKLVAERIQKTDKNGRIVPIELLRKYLTGWWFDCNLPRSRE